jgi:hypothetical protein
MNITQLKKEALSKNILIYTVTKRKNKHGIYYKVVYANIYEINPAGVITTVSTQSEIEYMANSILELSNFLN